MVIWFDPDAYNDSVEYGSKLFFEFEKVVIGYDYFLDPGDLQNHEISDIFNTKLKTVSAFKLDTINKRQLQL
jgi:hypothetical protein